VPLLCYTVTYLTNFSDTAGGNNDSISENDVHSVSDESEWPAGVGTSSAGTATGRKFQSSWMSKYPWITYSDSKVFCQVCQKCDQLGLFTFTHQRDEAFTSVGYDNWKHALAKFSTHESSKSHKEAVLKVDNAVRGINIAIQLSHSHQRERDLARSALMCIVSSLQYLCAQGLAVRGHTEETGNFENLLQLRAHDNAALKSWLDKSGYRWLSPAIQNEIIQDLGALWSSG